MKKIIMLSVLIIFGFLFPITSFANECECGVGPHSSCCDLGYVSINYRNHYEQCCCFTLGKTAGKHSLNKSIKEHNFTGNATCITPKKCSDCQYKVWLPHNYSETCSKSHCNVKICSMCGEHKSTCLGDCNTSGNCTHCNVSYCTKVTTKRTCGHTCVHNTDGYCNIPHCTTPTGFCTRCGHTCDGGHVFTDSLRCGLAHCGKKLCTKCDAEGVITHETEPCGGGHTPGVFAEDESDATKHNQLCGRTDLTCTAVYITHNAQWGQPDTSHTASCNYSGCTVKNIHSASWKSQFFSDDGKHKDGCSIVVNGYSCSAYREHTPDWSSYEKVTPGDSSPSKHIRYCQTAECDLTDVHEPVWGEWVSTGEIKHARTCSVNACGLQLINNHFFNRRELIEEDRHDHYKVCDTCKAYGGAEESYRLKEKHCDENIDINTSEAVGNGVCDLCKMELWEITLRADGLVIDETTLTNKDIEISGVIYSDYDENLNKQDDDSFIGSPVTTTKNGTYYVSFTNPNCIVPVTIRNINKTIRGEVFASTEALTSDPITLTFAVSTEGFNKKIRIGEMIGGGHGALTEGPAVGETTFSIEKTVTKNGTYSFYAEDTLGNTLVVSYTVDNIVSGQATIAVTYDVFVGGYIFTDVLVNMDKEWLPANEIITARVSELIRPGGSEIINTIETKNISKVYVADKDGKKVAIEKDAATGKDIPISAGTYYIRVSMGGPDVFEKEAIYLIDLRATQYTNTDGIRVTVDGTSRLEVDVENLKDLT